MYNITRDNNGRYTKWTFVKRGLELISPREFLRTSKLYKIEGGTIWRLFDFYWSVLRYGTIVSDYFEYEFWKKTGVVRREYVTMLDSKRLKKHFNKGRIELFFDKEVFNTTFEEFHKLKNWYFDKSKKEEDLIKWVIGQNRKIIVKPKLGSCGIGIFVPDVSTDEKIRNLFQQLKSNNELYCEEYFNQTGILHDVNPSSLNTIRVGTLCKNDKVHFMMAGMRIGGAKAIVDNIHSGGMIANVDINIGILTDAAYNLKGDRFLFHPASHVLIPGIQIPRWEEVKAMCEAAAKMVPNVGFIGWGVAVSDERVCLIEGNPGGNFDAFQVAAQKGCRKEYFAVMKEN